jgi:hypothetical protein
MATDDGAKSYVMGVLTLDIDGAIKKVAELESVSVEQTSDLHTRNVSDQRKPREIIPTHLKFVLNCKRAYINSALNQAFLDGKALKGILYGMKAGTNKPVPLRNVMGFVISKNNLGDFDGTKHVVEDFSGEAADVIPMD